MAIKWDNSSVSPTKKYSRTKLDLASAKAHSLPGSLLKMGKTLQNYMDNNNADEWTITQSQLKFDYN